MEDTNFYTEVGANIKRARKAKGITQEALAAHISLTRTSLTNIEKGRQRLQLHTFARIITVLDISPDSLLPKGSQTESIEKHIEENFDSDTQEWIKAALKNP